MHFHSARKDRYSGEASGLSRGKEEEVAAVIIKEGTASPYGLVKKEARFVPREKGSKLSMFRT